MRVWEKMFQKIKSTQQISDTVGRLKFEESLLGKKHWA